jgi:hypothetical protein
MNQHAHVHGPDCNHDHDHDHQHDHGNVHGPDCNQQQPERNALKDVCRNYPCTCGSHKKYKKCHAA